MAYCIRQWDQRRRIGIERCARVANIGNIFPEKKKKQFAFHEDCVFRMIDGPVTLTRPISFNLVNMTTMVELCSHSIRQKSSAVSCSGPCAAIYALR